MKKEAQILKQHKINYLPLSEKVNLRSCYITTRTESVPRACLSNIIRQHEDDLIQIQIEMQLRSSLVTVHYVSWQR